MSQSEQIRLTYPQPSVLIPLDKYYIVSTGSTYLPAGATVPWGDM